MPCDGWGGGLCKGRSVGAGWRRRLSRVRGRRRRGGRRGKGRGAKGEDREVVGEPRSGDWGEAHDEHRASGVQTQGVHSRLKAGGPWGVRRTC